MTECGHMAAAMSWHVKATRYTDKVYRQNNALAISALLFKSQRTVGHEINFLFCIPMFLYFMHNCIELTKVQLPSCPTSEVS
jgi:hypothetical protein